MNVSELNNAAKQIAIKKAIIKNDSAINQEEVTHYEKGKLFFETQGNIQLIIIPKHGTPVLGFECNGQIFYQCLVDRHPEKLELLKSLNSAQ